MTPRLYRVIIVVSDIETASGFYSDILQSTGERVSPGRHYYDLGGTILAVYDPAADGDDAGDWKYHESQYIYICVDNLEQMLERAKSGGATMITDKIEKMPWGERLFYIHDPVGTPICFVDSNTIFTGGSE